MYCIAHIGHLDQRGYGQRKYKGKVVFAHRLALALAEGSLVKSVFVFVLHQVVLVPPQQIPGVPVLIACPLLRRCRC